MSEPEFALHVCYKWTITVTIWTCYNSLYYVPLLIRHLGLSHRHYQIQPGWNGAKALSQSSLQCCFDSVSGLCLSCGHNGESWFTQLCSFSALSTRHGYSFETAIQKKPRSSLPHSNFIALSVATSRSWDSRCEGKATSLLVGSTENRFAIYSICVPFSDPQERSHQISLPDVRIA